jgi:hypothetical protein
MNLKDIEGSSNVTGIGFDPATKTLRVRFKGGSLYDHHDFTPEDHAAFMAADSKGSHYHSAIKGKFKFTKVPT